MQETTTTVQGVAPAKGQDVRPANGGPKKAKRSLPNWLLVPSVGALLIWMIVPLAACRTTPCKMPHRPRILRA